MRFQQLKHDPNNVTKKRLVKSKKNWVVLTSLSIASGLLLFSAPELTVDAASNDVKTATKTTAESPTNTAPTSSKQVPAPTISSQITSTSKTATPTVESPVNTAVATATNKAIAPVPTVNKPTTPSTDVKDATTKPTADQTTPIQKPVQSDKTIQQPTNTTSPNDISNKIDPRLKIPTLKPGSIIGNVVNSITGTGNKGSETIDSEASIDTGEVVDPMKDKTNLDSGISHTSHWYISDDKTLHFIDGTLEDNKGKQASPWSKDSDNITSASFDGKVKASEHMNNMFSNLPRLEHINHLENVDFSQTKDISGMLSNDTKLQSVDLTKGSFSNVKTVHGLFENDTNLKTVNMKNSSFRVVTDYSNLFKNDTSLSKTDVSSWQMLFAQNLSGMFQNDISLSSIDIGSWDISTNAITGDSSKNEGMFDGTNFSSIRLGSYNRFSKNTALPSNLSNTWQEVVNGSPTGQKKFNINQLGVIYPQTSTTGAQYVKMTFAPKPGAVKGSLQIPTSIDGGKTIVNKTIDNVTGNVGDTIIINAPIINGYTPSRSTVTVKIIDKNTITVTDGTLEYTGNIIHDAVVTIPITMGSQTQTVSGITGHVGDTVNIPIPQKVGYTTDGDSVQAKINADGTVTPNGSIHYSPNSTVTTSMIVTSNQGDITISNITGHHVGDQFTVTVPGKKGYNHGQSNTVHAVVDTLGNIVMADPKNEKIQYIGDTVSNLTLTVPVFINGKPSDDKVFTCPSAVVGKQVDLQVDNRPNYDVNLSTISAIVTSEGKLKLIDPKTQINYNGTLEKGSVSPENNLNLPIKIDVSGHVGETVQVKVPNEDGYHTSDSPINVKIGPNNSFETNDKINYLPNDAPTQDVTIHTNKGDKIIKAVSGHHVNDSFDLKTPDEHGYSPDKKQVHATIDLKGHINVSDQVTYSPDTVSTTITLNTNMGPKTVNVSGKVDSTTKVGLPHIPGYTPNKDIISVGFGTDEKPSFDTHEIIYTGNPADAQDVTVHSNQKGQTVHIDNSHKVGESFTVQTPPLTGYKPKDNLIHFTIDTNGHAVTTDTIDYQGDLVTGKVKINSNYPETIFQTATGKVGDTVNVDVPKENGYTADKKQIQVIINPDHTITTKDEVTYTGNKIDGKVLVNVTLNGKSIGQQEIAVNQVQIGSIIHPKPNTINGYHLKDKNFVMNASVTPKGITTGDTVDYVGNSYDNTVLVNSNLGEQKLHIVGIVGKTVKVAIPTQTNYHLENPTIDVKITPEGISPIKEITYLGDPVTNLTLKIPTYKNGHQVTDTLVPISNANVGDKIPFTPKGIPGYTPDKETIWGIVDANKEISTTEAIHYHGNEIDNGKLTVNITLNGTDHQTETINIDKTNVGSTLTPKPNKIPGYHLDSTNPKLTATVDDNGHIKTTDHLNYIGDPVDSTLEVPSNLGIQHIKVTGKVGDKLDIPVSAPDGYKPSQTTIFVTIGTDKKPKTNDTINFIGKKYTKSSVTISSNKGKQVVTDLSGQVGQKLTINVPKIPGYIADKTTIAAIMNADGSITALENITYNQIPHSTSQSDTKVISHDIHVNTFNDQPKISVYKHISDNQMQIIPNDLIDPGTAFLSIEEIQIGDTKYYQVGANEYIKVSQVYPFVPIQQRIKISDKVAAPLYTATGSVISLRHVVSGSIWKVDQIIILNGIKYYRIGTNAFVSEKDAILYQ